MMGAKLFGASVKRKEDPAFLTGGGRFIDDNRLFVLNANKVAHLFASKRLVDFIALLHGKQPQLFIVRQEVELAGFFQLFGAVNGFAHQAAAVPGRQFGTTARGATRIQ